ncbi:unnamed protein product [Ectocarpus sp. 12 AP-2014]
MPLDWQAPHGWPTFRTLPVASHAWHLIELWKMLVCEVVEYPLPAHGIHGLSLMSFPPSPPHLLQTTARFTAMRRFLPVYISCIESRTVCLICLALLLTDPVPGRAWDRWNPPNILPNTSSTENPAGNGCCP